MPSLFNRIKKKKKPQGVSQIPLEQTSGGAPGLVGFCCCCYYYCSPRSNMGVDAQGSLMINRGMRMRMPVSGSAMSDAMGSSRMSGGRMASGSSDGNTKVGYGVLTSRAWLIYLSLRARSHARDARKFATFLSWRSLARPRR